jgi:hypothetical protein
MSVRVGIFLGEVMVRKLLILTLIFYISSIAGGSITLNVFEADGATPFDCNDDIMIGTKLIIIINSDSNDYWSGGLFIEGQDRALGTLTGRGLDANDPNTRDYEDSHYEDAGEFALVTSWEDSSIWGFDLYTYYPVDGNSDNNSTCLGDWFVIDYEANEVGDCNIGFYDYNISWEDPDYFLSFSHSSTRDLNADDKVNFADFAIFASQWDANECNDPNWCDGADLDRDNDVDYGDLGLFVEYWLWQSDLAFPAGGRSSGGDSGFAESSIPEQQTIPEEPNDSCGESETRTYAYIITVGAAFSSESYDYYTINDAISAMANNELDECHLGCIQVYPGTYAEQLNDFYSGGHNLPAYCDLIGMGDKPEDVVIQHKRRSSDDPNFTNIASEIYADGVSCDGDNIVENLKIHNVGANQNSIRFSGIGTLKNCIIYSDHDAVSSLKHVVVSGCTISGMYRPCIHAYSTFEISDCVILPRTRSWGGQHPAAIKAIRSGTVDNVIIEADIASSDYEPHYDTPWLAGIIVQLSNAQDTVRITNTTMNLTLTTLYHDDRPSETANWELFGVVSGGRNPVPNTLYPGRTIVENCQINLTGIEDGSNPNGDGRAIMVAGVCVQGGGVAEVLGDTRITTSRTAASYEEEGYEYSLNNQNGTLTVDSKTVDYDDKQTNGTISKLK